MLWKILILEFLGLGKFAVLKLITDRFPINIPCFVIGIIFPHVFNPLCSKVLVSLDSCVANSLQRYVNLTLKRNLNDFMASLVTNLILFL